jgi:hypothetical protein
MLGDGMPGNNRSIHLLPVVYVLVSLCILTIPVHAFTSDALDITIDKNGDAVAQFQFTLEGIVENSIPQSMLESELKKGLTTSSDPPEVLSFDRTGATLLLKNFAVKNDVPTGTEYATASMDFSKAEIALKNSALSYVVSADFSPKRLTVRFPDGYTREFSDVSILPTITHTVIDPSKPRASPATTTPLGNISVNSIPSGVHVSIDSVYVGDTPSTFSDITPGQHTVLCELTGFLPYTKTVNVTAGKTETVNAVLSYGSPATTVTQTVSQPPVNTAPGLWIVYVIAAVVCVVIAGAVIGSEFLRRYRRH